MSYLRKVVKKRLIERFSINFFERALALSILKNEFSGVRIAERFKSREQLWQTMHANQSRRAISVLEFGVFEGYSIKYFASLNTNHCSRFFGFDSFEGLPENWIKSRPKGCFDVMGMLPETDDKRISFVKGWFQNTIPKFISENKLSDDLFVHFDADLYSATLFAMMEIDKLKKPYLAIFDEFMGHETRALYNYCQMTGASVEFVGAVGDKDYPTTVSCRVSPVVDYRPDVTPLKRSSEI